MDRNNNEDQRPSKMRGVVFPKAKYGVIAAIIIIVVGNIFYYKDFLTVFNKINLKKFMCGIVGIYLKNKKFEKNLGKMLSGMLNNMESRGPDSAGFAIYKDESKKLYKFSLCINDLNLIVLRKKYLKNLKKPNLLKSQIM